MTGCRKQKHNAWMIEQWVVSPWQVVQCLSMEASSIQQDKVTWSEASADLVLSHRLDLRSDVPSCLSDFGTSEWMSLPKPKMKWPHSKTSSPKHLTMPVRSSPSLTASEQPRAHDQGDGTSSLMKSGSVHGNRSMICPAVEPMCSIAPVPLPKMGLTHLSQTHNVKGCSWKPFPSHQWWGGASRRHTEAERLTGLCWRLHLSGGPRMGDPAAGFRAPHSGSDSAPFWLDLLSWSSTCTAGVPPKIYWHGGAHTADTSWGSPMMPRSSRPSIFLSSKGQCLHVLACELNDTSVAQRCLK